MTITAATSMSATDGTSIQVTGTTDDPASFIAGYTSALEGDGFTSDSAVEYSGEENWAAVFEGGYTVVINVVAFGDEAPVVSVMVLSSS